MGLSLAYAAAGAVKTFVTPARARIINALGVCVRYDRNPRAKPLEYARASTEGADTQGQTGAPEFKRHAAGGSTSRF